MRYSYNLLLLPLYNTRLNESKNEIYLIILGKGGSRMVNMPEKNQVYPQIVFIWTHREIIRWAADAAQAHCVGCIAGYGLSSSAAQSREHGIFLKVNRTENLPVSQVFLYQSILMCHFPYGAHGLSIQIFHWK